MAKKIIFLERLSTQKASFRVAYWADVPSARQTFYADASKASAWGDASAAEIIALQNGSVVERVETFSAQVQRTRAEIKMALQVRWVAFQAEINAANPWNFYGSSWDGTAWTDEGVL